MTEEKKTTTTPSKAVGDRVKELEATVEELSALLHETAKHLDAVAEQNVKHANFTGRIIDVLEKHEDVLLQLAPWAALSNNPNSLKNRRNPNS